MTASNTYGKQVVVPLTNKSGGGVVLGDVVIIDTANNDAFTTTTSAAVTQIVGVAAETIASNAVGRVVTGGYISLVNVNASVTRGHYGTTHTVAKQATDGGASRTAGTFCEFLTGGTTPDAMIYNTDLTGVSLTNPMTTGGDIIYGGASGTPTRLANGSSGQVLTSAGGTSAPTWGAAGGFLQVGTGQRTAGNLTTASASFVDATDLTVTMTTGAHRLMISLNAAGLNSGGAFYVCVDLVLDGSSLSGNTYGMAMHNGATAAALNIGPVFTSVLSAGSHTVKVQFCQQGGGTAQVYGVTSVLASKLTVAETSMTT